MGTLVFQATLGGAVNIIGPNIASTINFTLPSADGSSGQTWTTNGSGVLSFGTLGIGGGGTGQTTATAAFNALAPSQTGNSGKYLTTDGTNTSWATNPLGTVTSVAVSGGTTGLTTSGGPITTSGTITFAGTLATTNGGTNLTSFTSGGVVYASSSSALATGSGLIFNGTDLGVGVTPNNAGTLFGYKNYELPLAAFASFDVGSRPVLQLKSNVYYNSSFAPRYIGTGFATQYSQDSGEHIWLTAASGSAGGAVSFTQAMTLDASGNLGIGTTSVNPTGLAILSGGQGKGVLVARNVSGGASPTSGQSLGSYAFKGIMDGANSNVSSEAMIEAVAAENQSGSTAATSLVFYTKPSGTGPGSSPTERMRLDSAGIVTMSAYGAGAATFSAAGVISSVSDETWKVKDGVPTDPDAMLKKLEPGYWYYNAEKKETFGTERHLGFYAQNVNAAIGPEAAPEPEEGKPWGYYDRSVLAVTVMSLQKALATIESLKARLDAANL